MHLFSSFLLIFANISEGSLPSLGIQRLAIEQLLRLEQIHLKNLTLRNQSRKTMWIPSAVPTEKLSLNIIFGRIFQRPSFQPFYACKSTPPTTTTAAIYWFGY